MFLLRSMLELYSSVILAIQVWLQRIHNGDMRTHRIFCDATLPRCFKNKLRQDLGQMVGEAQLMMEAIEEWYQQQVPNYTYVSILQYYPNLRNFHSQSMGRFPNESHRQQIPHNDYGCAREQSIFPTEFAGLLPKQNIQKEAAHIPPVHGHCEAEGSTNAVLATATATTANCHCSTTSAYGASIVWR
jgi:hypothetical protein